MAKKIMIPIESDERMGIIANNEADGTAIINLSKEENHAMAMGIIKRYLETEVHQGVLIDYLVSEDNTFTNEQLALKSYKELVELVMESGDWYEMVRTFSIEGVHVCERCDKPMIVGVQIEGECYCCDDCIFKSGLTQDDCRAALEEEDAWDNGTCYTEWTAPDELDDIEKKYAKEYLNAMRQ